MKEFPSDFLLLHIMLIPQKNPAGLFDLANILLQPPEQTFHQQILTATAQAICQLCTILIYEIQPEMFPLLSLLSCDRVSRKVQINFRKLLKVFSLLFDNINDNLIFIRAGLTWRGPSQHRTIDVLSFPNFIFGRNSAYDAVSLYCQHRHVRPATQHRHPIP